MLQLQNKCVPEIVSEEGKVNRAKIFLAEMKKTLSQVNFERIVQALQAYKKTDNLDTLLAETAVLAEDANTQNLLRGNPKAFSSFTAHSLHN